ncbi:hypothetical protein [Devosia sediminis]|uniref:Uncharacterized protein n=1 Tax=Devosia sediminis TaxID=2798801 RepID=A0A934MHB7_9HYPH|nr:hypothetical protein [Devosia sediminis]MBJ3784907.1 hypothetical protein [Devosia sediminis]
MTLAEIERLAGELLATGEMNADTAADLDRIVAEARAGTSYPDDLDYLAALHARLLSPNRVVEDVTASSPDVEADLRGQISQLQAELADARQTIAELQERLASGA